MTYDTTREHLFDEIERIETILTAVSDGHTEGGYPDRTASTAPAELTPVLPADIREAVSERASDIDRRCAETTDTTLRLKGLAERFGLSRTHLDVFLLALLPDIDVEYQQLYASVQDETGTTLPTVDLVASLFGATTEAESVATALVGSSSPLRRHGLITLTESTGASTSHRRRQLMVDQRLVSYLEGHHSLDPALDGIASLVETGTTVEDLRLDGDTRARVEQLAAGSETAPSIHYFWGPDGAEKTRAVEAIADQRVLRADLDRLLRADQLDRFRREALLQDRPVHLTNVSEATADAGVAEADERERQGMTVDEVVDALAVVEADLFLTGSERWTPAANVRDVAYALVEFPKPGFELRKRCWEDHASVLRDGVSPTVLANTFELTQAGIDGAVEMARAISAGDDEEPLSRDTVIEGCKAQSATGLGELAVQIEPDSTWDEIVLPPDTERQLSEVAAHVKHRGTIYEEWGLEDRFSRGTGVVAMFAGPSGTGKTLAAEIIAGDVGMDLYQIDLSSVVSKHIGGPEENLERIFDAARDSNAILLFDEADAVFGQRAGVNDATDRYTNIDVNYLFQRIESYDGVVLLTTNNASHIDDAFMRRIHQTVSFQQPDEDAREEIWKIIFPEATPTANLDYEFLAGLELSGANIRNVARTAAVLAADDGAVVQMEHVVEASRRELEKLGGLVDSTDFGEYRDLLRSTSTADGGEPDTGTPTQSDSHAPSNSPVGLEEPTAKDLLSADTSDDGSLIRKTTAAEALRKKYETREEPPAAEQLPETSMDQQPQIQGRPQETYGSTRGAPAGEPTNDPEPTDRSTQALGSGTQSDDSVTDDHDSEERAIDTGDDGAEAGDAPSETTAEDKPEASGQSDTSESETDHEAADSSDASPSPTADVSVSGTPEMVIEEFFGYLTDGDGAGAHMLYHEQGFAEEFSARELTILDQCSLSVSGYTRVVDEPSQVVIQFVQSLDGDENLLEYELRPEDGQWRIFDLRQVAPDDAEVDTST